MPSLREYFKNKNLKHQSDFRKKLIQHKRAITTRTVLIVILSITAALAIYISYENKVYVEYEVVRSVERDDAEQAEFIDFSGNILKYSRDGATAFDSNDTILWNEAYEMQNPLVDICKNFAAIGDYRGNKIYIMNESGLQGEIITDLPIMKFEVSAQGRIAVLLEDRNEMLIRLYSVSGEIISDVKATMRNSGYPLDLCLSDDGIKLGVSYILIERGSIKSSIAFYNFGSVGQDNIDHFMSGYDYQGTIVPMLKYINNSTAFAVGDNKFVIYKGSQKPVLEFETDLEDEVHSVFYNESYIGLVYRGGGEEGKYKLDIYDTAGNLALVRPFDLEYTDIIFNKDLVIIYNDTECCIYNMGCMEKFQGEFPVLVSMIIPTDKKTRYILVSRGSTQVIQLK